MRKTAAVVQRVQRTLDRNKSSILIGLLIIETLFLLFVVPFRRPVESTTIPIVAGHNYSLLIDNERFPIRAHPKHEMRIEIFPSGLTVFTLPRRVVIPQYKDQDHMAAIAQPRFRFYYNRPSELQALFAREHLRKCVRSGDWQTVLAAMNQVSTALKMGMPLIYPPQDALRILDLMRNGREEVFCAQYCYVTVQFLQALGFFARHITIDGHEVCEVWLPSERKWVCLDPTHNAYFLDPHGKKLSALDIARNPADASAVSPTFKGDLSSVPKLFGRMWFWLTNNLATHPVNIYDLNKYRVHVVLNPRDLDGLEPGDLYTLFPDELYTQPSY